MGRIAGPIVAVPGPWEHRMVSANGARFHVAESGSGPLVVLLHGFPAFWWSWRHQVVSLAEAGYRVVAMDLRGYGDSDKPPRGYDPFTLSADVAGVVRSLGAADATVVGHAWGGLLAWSVGVLHPKVVRSVVTVAGPHPRRIRSALLTDGAQLRASRHAIGFQRPWSPERALVRDDAAMVEELLRAWSPQGWPADDVVARYRLAICQPQVAHSALEYFRWAARSFVRPDGVRYARRMTTPVAVPVLQVHGAADAAVLTSTARGSERYVSGPFRFELMDGVGHFPHEEQPARFDELLLGWLREADPVG